MPETLEIPPRRARPTHEPHALQRTTGVVRLAFEGGEGGTRLRTLYQQGAGRARLPRVPAGAPPEAVLLNTAGGLTGGDRMTVELRLAPRARATVTTQASERIYRSAGGCATVVNRVHVARGACAEWLPQETIVFDGARLDRTLEVAVDEGGEALLAEALVFGRTAMGETVRTGRFRDRWRVRRGGRLVFAEGAVVEGDVAAALARPLALHGGCAFASVLRVAPDAERALEAVRAVLGEATDDRSVRAGASAWDGLLAVRLAAVDGATLRRSLEGVLEALRPGRPLPTVWRC